MASTPIEIPTLKTPASGAPRAATPLARPAARGATMDPLLILRQNWKRLCVWAVIAVFASGIFQVGAQFVYPIYGGNVLLRLRPQLGEAKEIFGEATTQEETVARLAQTEAQQMITRNVLVAAVANRDILKTKWHEYYLDSDGKLMIDDAVDDLEDEISAGHRRGTQFFALYWSAHVAGDVPIVLNTVSTTYLTDLRSESDKKFNETKSVFQRKQLELDQQIDSMKKSIRDFITTESIPSFEENSQQTQRGLEELQHRISQTTEDLSLIKSQRMQIDAKLKGRLEPSEDDLRVAENDPPVLQLTRDINDMTIRLESQKAKFGPEHPEIRTSTQQLASAITQKERAILDIVTRDLAGQFKKVSDRQSGLEDLMKKQTGDFEIEATRVEELASRVAELEAKKDLQARLEEERGELTKTIGELDLARARKDSIPVEIAQQCLTPRELAFPNWKVVLPGAWFVVFGFGVGLIFLREFLDQRVRVAGEVASITGGKLLGVIPDLADDESNPVRVEFVVRESPQSVLAESFRQVSTNLSKALREHGSKVVGVFSTMPEAGATAAITNLASSARVVGKRVLVIDANFRKPSTALALGASEESVGLADVLCGTAEFAQAIQTTSHGIDVLNAGHNRAVELFDTAKFAEVMAIAREQYDLTLIDTAPAAIAAEAFVIANRIDASLLVVRAMRDQRGLVARLVAQLNAQQARFVGAILVRPEQTAGGYYRKNARAMIDYAAKPATSDQVVKTT
ncbi:MAG: hypothetical protein EXS15_07600 [Phycisphaerales bacterium]|nr:hypothetical protein [Phycisphaerales bacterium]